MIPKMTSHELNKILEEANNKLTLMSSDIKNIKTDISNKLKILRFETDYMEHKMIDLTTAHRESKVPYELGQSTKTFVYPNQKLSNTYEKYGSTITPKFKNSPVNVFNIMATATGEAFYRDIAEVSINGVVKEEYKNILKHDRLNDKEIFFLELDDTNPSLEISISLDKTKTLGNSLFNMIELDMFLNGAYTIDHIRIYKENIVGTNGSYDEFINIEEAGKMRLAFNKEYSLNKIDIKITPTFSTQVNGTNKYPLGIKHIYLYNAKFLTNSFAIAEIESEDFIDKIDNNFSLVRPNETLELEADKEGIEFYLNYTMNPVTGEPILTTIQEPSKSDNTRLISLNVKKIYAKIPLKVLMATEKNEEISNQSITGFVFNTSSKIM